MQNEHEIVAKVYSAKEDMHKADELIKAYIPFIRAEAAKTVARVVTEQDDEFSIAMIAFHEAIRAYEKSRGAFLKYASMVIRSRLIDYHRAEEKHKGSISIYEETGDGDTLLHERLTDGVDHASQSAEQEATQQEIAELSKIMSEFGISFTDVAENSPNQRRTLEACGKVVQFAIDCPEILQELLETKKLPLIRLTEGTGVPRKTLERHRKYILAMLLIQTNGYEIIRGHLRHVYKRKGGESV